MCGWQPTATKVLPLTLRRGRSAVEREHGEFDSISKAKLLVYQPDVKWLKVLEFGANLEEHLNKAKTSLLACWE